MPITAHHVIPTTAGYDSPHYAADLYRYAHLSDHAAVQALCSPGGAPRTINLPVDAHHREIAATMQGSYFNDYYHRIHVRPAVVDLGNVISAQHFPVFVFNALFTPVTLQSIDGLAEGLALSGQADPPLDFAPLQERTYQASVTPDGPPALDATISFDFGSQSASIRILGNRIVAWTFTPNWADGVTEKLSWLTDVLKSESMVEQRRALRIAPRREISAQIYAEGRERQMLDAALFGWSARVWALPIWADVQWLPVGVAAGAQTLPCDTAYLDFVAGGLALLRGESAAEYEVLEITAVTPTGLTFKRPVARTWAHGTRLYPVRRAIFAAQPKVTRLTDRLADIDVRFRVVEPCDWPEALPQTVYRGRPVLEDRPDESEDLRWGFDRLLKTLDNKTSSPVLTDIAGYALPVWGWRWVDAGRDKRAALRSLFYSLRGQQTAVWIPTHADDMTVAAPAPASHAYLDIVNIGYSRFCAGCVGRQDIRIEFTDGSTMYRRITRAGALDDATERIEFGQSHGRDITPESVARISYLQLCRLSSDDVTIEHMTDSEGVASCAVTFRGVRDDDL